MIEARWKIESYEDTRNKILELKAKQKGKYSATDIIFIPKNNKSLNKEFIRVRSYIVNNWNTKNVVLTHKETRWINNFKEDIIAIKREFDKEQEAIKFIEEQYKNSLKELVRFKREGEDFEINNNKLFLETLEYLGPTIEIETDSKELLIDLEKQLALKERITQSIPETIRLLKNNESLSRFSKKD
ncbi:hypothetical protein J4216_01950 [Candidatus Woesearchaeota archaeon]|nr:hypothetical protein [Candidatus Woesearchaeota archaeon]